jgi:hypothetical protein
MCIIQGKTQINKYADIIPNFAVRDMAHDKCLIFNLNTRILNIKKGKYILRKQRKKSQRKEIKTPINHCFIRKKDINCNWRDKKPHNGSITVLPQKNKPEKEQKTPKQDIYWNGRLYD